MTSLASTRPLFPRAPDLGRYLFLTWLVLLVNVAGFWPEAASHGLLAGTFTVAMFLTHTWLYLLPVIAAALVLDLLVRRGRRWGSAVVLGFALVGFSLVQVLVYADRFIFGVWGFHLNGFVWNLVATRGGIESLGSTPATWVSVTAIVTALFLVQVALLWFAAGLRPARDLLARLLRRRLVVRGAAGMLGLALLQQGIFGWSDLVSHRPVLLAADALPFYDGFTFRSLARGLGYEPTRGRDPGFGGSDISALRYPLTPIARREGAPDLNIVWLVAESWRYDMLDPEIMPATWAYAGRAARFTRHYSTGHGTTMGMFGLFYGLYANYYWAFLRENRPPVLMDLLVDGGYQFGMFTSARFTYPEFDRTIFARVPAERLHEEAEGRGWERDRRNVDLMLRFLDGREPDRPFMTFMFFESPHAPYHFPPEAAIRRPYMEDVNYAALDADADAGLLEARYVNSCRHLDTQFARVLEYLERQGLLDRTIVILTGDHGEAFMEKGRWGHNSDFSEEQTRSPLVIGAPGVPPAVVDRLTSHLDVAPTVLALLGVTNPPEDYSLGFDLFSDARRDHVVVGGWEDLAILDGEVKAIFSTSLKSLRRNARLTTIDDREIPDADPLFEVRAPLFSRALREMRRFGR